MGEQLSLPTAPPTAYAPLPELVTCFSLDQPYAGLVAAALKDETRLFRWPEKARPYPAPLLICSTKTPDKEARAKLFQRVPMDVAGDAGLWASGVALALVEVTACRVLAEADLPRSWFWAVSEAADGVTRYLWTIERVRRVAPFEVKGMQGFARRLPRRRVQEALRYVLPRHNAYARAQAIIGGHSVQCAELGDDDRCAACFG